MQEWINPLGFLCDWVQVQTNHENTFRFFCNGADRFFQPGTELELELELFIYRHWKSLVEIVQINSLFMM
jgi:hypothetical protein